VGVGAVIYARISEDHERAESVPTQIANATRHAERMGWDVARVFKDEGRSGLKPCACTPCAYWCC
jgi:Resolvase, N terminal domain